MEDRAGACPKGKLLDEDVVAIVKSFQPELPMSRGPREWALDLEIG
jgi:hypothetical protein